ncbi:InlB B-repeat-containing protein [Olsenella intestinalis]|uniref:InlB B-repeat-containing protein n=1 Tax=Olsenella intestinalis TaxID=2930083 RepID=UPI00200C957E|nr:InlB B-repeat-containing protein [Olsenella intestinalis]
MRRSTRHDGVRATLLALVLVAGLLPQPGVAAAADAIAPQPTADAASAADEPADPVPADAVPTDDASVTTGAPDAPTDDPQGEKGDALGQPAVPADAGDPVAPGQAPDDTADPGPDATGPDAPSSDLADLADQMAPAAAGIATELGAQADRAADTDPDAIVDPDPDPDAPAADDCALEPQVDVDLAPQAVTEGESVTLSRADATSWSSAAGGTQNSITLADDALYAISITGGKGGNVRNGNITANGGQGGTTSAVIRLEPTTIFACLAGEGGEGNASRRGAGGANGGGTGGARHGEYTHGAGGGGATHVAKVRAELANIPSDDDLYLVAGGGGGSRNDYNERVPGGGLSGGNAWGVSNGGTQTFGYARGLGQTGVNGVNASGNHAGGGGGGGGYFGGYNSIRPDPKRHRGTGGGGSGFINAALMGGTLVDNGGGAGSVVVDGVVVATTSRGGGAGAGTASVTYLASVVTLDAGPADAPGTPTLYAAPQSEAYYASYSVSGLADALTSIDVPTRAGYRFMGYFTAAEGGDLAIADDGTIEAGLFSRGTCTLHAQWRPLVTFDSNGVDATGMPDEQAVVSGEKSTRPADPSAGGKSFKGWSTSAGTYVPYDFDSPVTAPVELFAFWSPYVAFDLQGHGQAIEPQWLVLGESGQTATRPPDPVETGYTFGGWYTDPECEDGQEFDFATEIVSDTTVFAKWSANVYRISLKDGDAEKGVQSFVYNDAPKRLMTAAELGLEREGWRFAGWREDDELAVEFEDGAQIQNLSTGTGTIDFHALWVRDITFVSGSSALSGQADDASATSVPQLSDRASDQAIAAPRLVDVDGWRSIGWLGSRVAASAADVGAGTTFTPQSVTTFFGLYNRDVTLSFDGAGATAGEVEPQADVQRMNASGALTPLTFVLPANAFERDGWRFAGWSMGRPGDAVTLRPAASDAPDFVASALWAGPYQYFIAFDANGGAGAMGVQLAPEHAPTPLDACAFARDGYAFAGWNTAPDGTGASFAPGQSVTDLAEPGYQVVLYAQWHKLPDDPAAETSVASGSSAPAGRESPRAAALPETGDPLGWLFAWLPLA